MAAQLNRYLADKFSYLIELNTLKMTWVIIHRIFFAKFCNSIEKDKIFYKYNKINSILLVEKYNKSTSRSIIIIIKLYFVFLQILLMAKKTPVKEKNKSSMVNVFVKMLSGNLESSTDWVYNQARICCFVSPSMFVSFSKAKSFLCLMFWKEIILKKKNLLRNWKEINIFGGWL